MLTSTSPTTGEQIATYDEHTAEDVERLVELADARHREWRRLSFDDRAAVLDRAGDLLDERADELAVLMADEMGKPVADGRAEARKCAWVCRYYAEHAESFLADVPVETDHTTSYVHHEPIGVVLAVMPWNFPFWQVFRFAAPTLMAGNAGLLKHAGNVTGCALAIEAVLADAGLPEGCFSALRLPSARVKGVIESPLVRAVTLTGSGPAGAAVASTAGAVMKKSVLELGGSDAYVVLADADVADAAEVCATSRLVNGGQSCIAAKRFVVEAPVHDQFLEALVEQMASRTMGDPRDEDTQIGPQARHDLRDDLHSQVERTVAAGARVELGGEVPDDPGAFYPATVLAGVEPGMPAHDEETFGPVAAVIEAADEEDAVRIANQSQFGLGGAVFTGDVERGERLAATRLEAGSCFVNAMVASDPRLPFGGIKESGYGRELSSLGIKEFVNAKTVVVA